MGNRKKDKWAKPCQKVFFARRVKLIFNPQMTMPSWLHLIWGKPSGMVYFYSMKTNKSNIFLHPIVVHRQLNRIRIANVCLSQLSWALGWWRNRGPTRQRRKRLIFCVTSWHHECFSWFLRILPKNKNTPICLNFKIYSFCQFFCHRHLVPSGYGSCIYIGQLHKRKDPSSDLWNEASAFLHIIELGHLLFSVDMSVEVTTGVFDPRNYKVMFKTVSFYLCFGEYLLFQNSSFL